MILTTNIQTFIRTSKNKIHKCMTAASKNVCIIKLNEIVDIYNKLYHRTTKRKPGDGQPDIY